MTAISDRSVLFICLGNTCRSPIAEAVFIKQLKKNGLLKKWHVDSAAIVPWHIGSKPNPRAISVLKQNNIKINHRARQIEISDFEKFEFIIGMDEGNMIDLKQLAPPNAKAKLLLLGSFDPSGELEIEDPYCKGEEAFHKTLEHCTRACQGFLNSVIDMAATSHRSVLFICLGNICRSPIAEAVFRKLLKEKGLFEKGHVDSAAIGPWHVGSKPNARAISVLNQNNIEIKHKARQIEKSDFEKFEFILGMDEKNMSDLKRLAPPNAKAKLQLLGSYDPSGELEIEDPYYTKGEKGFHKTLEHCTRACESFLNSVIDENT